MTAGGEAAATGSFSCWDRPQSICSGKLPRQGFYLGCREVKATRRIVVHAGDETYGLGDGVEAASLAGALAALRRS